MKKTFKLLVLAITLVMLIGTFNFVNATSNDLINKPVSELLNESGAMPKDENIGTSLMPINEKVSEDGTFLDDLYKIGEFVSVTQDVSGNVYIMAERINIEKVTIEGNLFLIGEEIVINDSYISGSAFIIGDDIRLNSLIQDVYLLENEIKFETSSYISRTARIGAESVIIAGIIDRDCYIDAENIKVLDNTEIAGTLEYNTSRQADIGANSSIANVKANIIEKVEKVQKTPKINFSVYDFLSALFKAFVVGGILILILNKKIKNVEKMNIVEFIKSLALGSVLIIAIPILSMIFIVTLIGAGLGLLVILIYILLLFISTIVMSIMIAKNFVNEDSKLKLLGMTILVYMVYKLLCVVPTLAILLVLILGLTGLGYIPRIIWAKEKQEDTQVIENN